MTQEETELMAIYGITEETKSVFIYKDYKYGRLQDAVNYAKLEAKRSEAAASEV